MLHGCTIDASSLVGMSATILNGARIGPESLVGAGSLITEGRTFERRQLILGVPAKALRELDDTTTQRLRQSALDYVRQAERFANGLAPSAGSAT
jgi:carbonic anhydrase/acetyltransferase-like protein (isoleucine patch superfamily)